MTDAGSNEKATGHSYNQRPKDLSFALCFAAAAALLHTSALALEVARLAQFSTLVSHTTTYLLLIIGLGLLVNAAGLWLRKAVGVLVSLGALLVVGVGYGLWYLHSRQMLDLLLSKPFYQVHPEAVPPHPLGLIGATWLNLVVLVMSGVLFIWELKTLRSMKAAPPLDPDFSNRPLSIH